MSQAGGGLAEWVGEGQGAVSALAWGPQDALTLLAQPACSYLRAAAPAAPRSFGQECAPKGKCTFGPRLSDDEIRELAAYVLRNAEAGWPAQ